MRDQSRDTGTKTLDQQILAIFRAKPGGVVSGEELSTHLSVSRTAVWKHIKALKDLVRDTAQRTADLLRGEIAGRRGRAGIRHVDACLCHQGEDALRTGG